MKKLATLFIAAGLVFSVSTGANAIDFKAKGQWIMSFDYGQHGNFTGGHGQTGYDNKQDEFEARQRIRLQLDAVASEALSGTVYFEIGDTTWGKGGTEGQGSGGAMGADGVSVEVKRAYIDWMVPDTDLKVRMGIQGIQAPSFVLQRAQSFGDDVAGIALSYQFNEYVGATAFWARPYNDNFAGYKKNGTDGYNKSYMDNIDLGGLFIPLTFDGVKITPWGMIAGIGPNADRLDNHYFDGDSTSKWGTSIGKFRQGMLPAWGVIGSDGRTIKNVKLSEYGTAWWAGVTGDITYWDPFRVAFDFTAGGVSYDESRLNRAGWMAALLVEYKFDWGIPGLVGWYASGDDDDLGNGSERLPTLSTGMSDNDISHFAFDGNPYIAREGTLGASMAGTWGIGLRVKDFSFVEDLKHTFRINYIGGTNNHDILKKLHGAKFYPTPNASGLTDSYNVGVENMYLTDLDSALEIGLYNEYKMYDNFKIALDANYVAMFLDDSHKTWKGTPMNGKSRDVRDAWNVNVSFVYEF
ncbi:MAG: outer membrane homotrimeric porin [Desulfovibrio sp.]|nr:outer membrane homotrimeric porin [Desulfovibrio sp.]